MLIFLIASGLSKVSKVSANGDFSGTPGYMAPFSLNETQGSTSPCRPFFVGASPNPLPSCCEGARNVAELTSTKRDEQELCSCLKLTLPHEGVYDPARLASLGKKCNIDVYFPPITRDTDCSKWPSLALSNLNTNNDHNLEFHTQGQKASPPSSEKFGSASPNPCQPSGSFDSKKTYERLNCKYKTRQQTPKGPPTIAADSAKD
ncbi:hypothetical protein V6N12_031410 [Hibiscus sabdariffa]|uniref:Bifunctional inhibitor/plant lipid transfer protein/seed storage helical domain-containing protein n=1 Tax=Hibiscus sabdariffa TaxID=183260 RepID=A0ABR2B1W5_9ROSI